MDVGGMPHETFLRSIELLGKKVLPRIRKEIKRGKTNSSVTPHG
jgi:hypothetical protein